jgi:hypothetical protein
MTEAQSEAVTTPEGAGSATGISSIATDTGKIPETDITNTSLNQLYINRAAKTVMDNIVFVPGQNLINGIRLIEHIGGNLLNVSNPATTLPSIPRYFIHAVQMVIVVMYALIFAGSVLNA